MAMVQTALNQCRNAQPATSHIYDVVTVGFGTKALALAAAIKDDATSTNVIFLEQNDSFDNSHHEPVFGAEHNTFMQNSFLHDLATLRDPTSPFTFLNYLQAEGKLETFIQLQSTRSENDGFIRPPREEFHRYLCWAAQLLGDHVRYGEQVTHISRINRASSPVWRVVSRDLILQGTVIRFAKNVIFANTEDMANVAKNNDWVHTEAEKDFDFIEILDATEAMKRQHVTSLEDQFAMLSVHSKELVDVVLGGNSLLLLRAML